MTRNPWERPGPTPDPQVKRNEEIRDALQPVMDDLDASAKEVIQALKAGDDHGE